MLTNPLMELKQIPVSLSPAQHQVAPTDRCHPFAKAAAAMSAPHQLPSCCRLGRQAMTFCQCRPHCSLFQTMPRDRIATWGSNLKSYTDIVIHTISPFCCLAHLLALKMKIQRLSNFCQKVHLFLGNTALSLPACFYWSTQIGFFLGLGLPLQIDTLL